jgi:hypothetical protein
MNTSYFAQNLESLTLIIKDAGCKPILVTSLARRVFASEHVTTDILSPYSNETINVAKKLKLPVRSYIQHLRQSIAIEQVYALQFLPLLNDSLTYITKLGKTQSMLFNWDSATTNKGKCACSLHVAMSRAEESDIRYYSLERVSVN